jgi:hypothetical protein
MAIISKIQIAAKSRFINSLLAAFLLLSACSTGIKENNISQRKRYVVVEPGTHPSLLFSSQEIELLKQKANGNGLARDMWEKMKQQADNWTISGEWTNRGMAINANALIYQVEGDEQAGRSALHQMKMVLNEIDPYDFYFAEEISFFETEHWPKAFAFGYDWLYPLMSEEERVEIVKKLELWCKALYEHTEKNWWRDASYNCGAIPVGALGLLCVAIQAEAEHPEFEIWLNSALNRIRDNFYPTSWRQNGICYEGPCYAHYHKNPTMFGEALRRNGGPDIITGSGAINAMHYQRFQWMPHGGEGPIGDNTTYGRRVFQSIYLFGIGELNDRAGLHTFLEWTDRNRLNPIEAFIFYPADVEPLSAGQQDLYNSYYFEITPNKAGYLYSRSEWDNEDAAYFAFVTRYAPANHQHNDMNTFLFTAFGEEFATHANLYPYQDSLHGVDWEHNIVIIDGGGAPGHDAINGAGDDCSVNGYMTGVGTGNFADYVRGDAAKSYKDRSLKESEPAVRADRYGLFVKQGPNPYVIMIDDIQKSENDNHIYDWLWYSKALNLAGGEGTLANPLIIPGEKANCAIGFVTPLKPEYSFGVASGKGQRGAKLGLTSIRQQGNRVRYFAIGAAWLKNSRQPIFEDGPKPVENDNAYSVIMKGEGFTDHIIWQPEEVHDEPGIEIKCGNIITDALLTVVRTNSNGQVIGYLIGDGTKLIYNNNVLVQSDQVWSVSADEKLLVATGKRRARADLPPLPAKGMAWLPDINTQVVANGDFIETKKRKSQMITIEN